ncbi:CxxH/CxxC protein [Bacillus sp. CLL-7-23]|uniref:CxxH/CxxC protein n=1 Tax=Bacillus changyiensis TaxID=3004103 RepID=A0ABT4WYG3_9BACI|nr:CxxH/CxxC protein [Bacillus changyiensis]MDA7025091.1 CxxH/CxxC protein [Bacillus changyiensis]
MKSCEEHIETVIDMYVDEEEQAPEITKIEHIHNLSTTCELCDNQAVYIVGNK